MQTRIMAAALALVATVHLLNSGCSGDKPPSAPATGAPIACFTMSVELEPGANCPFQRDFIVNAGCSTDPDGPDSSLEVRWDLDNDGIWNSGFASIRDKNNEYIPEIGDSLWIVRCQVRDIDGMISERRDSLPFVPLPVPPDLIAGSVRFRYDSSPEQFIDTVRAGAGFYLLTFFVCDGAFMDPDFKVLILRNGAPVDTQMFACDGASSLGCGGGGEFGWVIDSAGTYVFTAVVDFENTYVETNEENNVVSDTLWVLP